MAAGQAKHDEDRAGAGFDTPLVLTNHATLKASYDGRADAPAR